MSGGKLEGVIPLFMLILVSGASSPVHAQGRLEVVNSLASEGRAEQARTELQSWWDDDRLRSSRVDRQEGLWLRAILTVDPQMATLDFQRLVLEYPGGAHSDEALLRLALIEASIPNLPRAAQHFQTLVRDYPRSPYRRRAQSWLTGNLAAVEEALAAGPQSDEPGGNAPNPAANTVADALAAPAPEVSEPEVSVIDGAQRASIAYAVQVGAFESAERARNLLASVNASGFEARIVRVEGDPLVRVRIGTFVDRMEAVELMNRVRRRGLDATLAADVADEEQVQ